ncbi:hypothetical protein TWF225_011776 [Orbilia oligospora]|nr:hypothetical protein TWF225_011776 [Orbilia oligospora]KAF3235983.1 hypothetical protein TWF128_001672 [Orbilia oligospora]KAF3248046.1 hypothetical protein TWF217_009496 [Orbilia oligospora]KAF3279264.1 hypothetical protein TWF132_000710 [Orbilia oligospora]
MSASETVSSGPFKFISQGAIVQEWLVGGKNIVLGFQDPAEYAKSNPAYFGATIGRVANRLANGQIKDIPHEGDVHPLPVNNGTNTLHGGITGWDKKYWTGPVKKASLDGSESLVYSYKSPHLDEKFPGTLDVTVRYTVRNEAKDGADVSILEIEYEAEIAADSPEDWAVLSLTNHSYFNIGDKSTIEGTQVTIPDNTNIETDEVDIPTGRFKKFPGIESGVPFELGAEDPDIDHGFALTTDVASVPIDTRGSVEKTCIKLYHPSTGVNLVVSSTEPAFQFYTGKYIETEARDDGTPAYGKRAGFCVEPARYTNAANVPEWKHMVLLKKGEVYGSRTTWKAWKSSSF